MDLGLSGSAAFVAASSKGLGKASAKRLAIEGANVAISSRNEDNVAAARSELLEDPAIDASQIHTCLCDLTDQPAIEQAIDEAADAFGGLDILVNNHGGPPAITFADATGEDWDAAYDGVLKSNINLIEAALPYLDASDLGNVVTITSASARETGENHALSNVFRLGLYGLTKTIAVEHGPSIRANCVTPRFVMTDRIEYKIERRAEHEGISVDEARRAREEEVLLDREGSPGEFADAVAFVASPRSSYTTGSVVSVDGGWSSYVLG